MRSSTGRLGSVDLAAWNAQQSGNAGDGGVARQGLGQEVADLGIIRRIIVALTDGPDVVFLREVQLVGALFKGDVRDVIDGQLGEEFPADVGVSAGADVILFLIDEESAEADDYQ